MKVYGDKINDLPVIKIHNNDFASFNDVTVHLVQFCDCTKYIVMSFKEPKSLCNFVIALC